MTRRFDSLIDCSGELFSVEDGDKVRQPGVAKHLFNGLIFVVCVIRGASPNIPQNGSYYKRLKIIHFQDVYFKNYCKKYVSTEFYSFMKDNRFR